MNSFAAIRDGPERLGANQALFRDINNRVENLVGQSIAAVPRTDFLCECADATCVEHLSISLDEYRAVRENPRLFAVAPADKHVFQEVERVSSRSDRYWVVEKLGEAAKIVEREALA